MAKLQYLEDKRKEEPARTAADREEEKEERGVQGSESRRGEGEGRVRMMEERRVEIIRTHREAGVGEEVLHVQGEKGEVFDESPEPKGRGEAEGGQKHRERTVATTSPESQKHLKSVEDNTVTTTLHLPVHPPLDHDVEILTKHLLEAQEEADRQTLVIQDLRSKLAEQSKKTWEAEQKLVVLEAEMQRLKKATESLGEARRQIEVWLEGRREMLRWWMFRF